MSCITPFLTEYIYQNLKHGIATDSHLYKESVHFLEMPNYDKALLNPKIEKMVKKM